MLKSLPTLLLLILTTSLGLAQSRFRLTCHVLNGQTTAPVAGANVLVLDTGLGAVTDSAGAFSLPLPKGTQTIQVSHQSYETAQCTVLARADVVLTILLNERVTLLREATVMAN